MEGGKEEKRKIVTFLDDYEKNSKGSSITRLCI